MNKILLTTALLLFSMSAGRTQSIDDNEKGLSVVKINAFEQGLLFYVDDSLVGALTDDEFKVRSGFHKLKVSSATDSWTAVDWTWEGTLIADSVYTFDVKMKQFIMLNTVPFGAKVIINGKSAGTTPLLLEKTNEAVEIVMSNYMPIRLEASQLANK
ncbi:MAG: PEGA domain-containing protein, partial [Candidatus Marinimicrobia bacterium]|nr:PEGA domain-containing protein [Candidatus Neomarinimicrobiota bacterium]